MSYDVFISYSHYNKAVADAICAYLEHDGIRCWYAPRDIQLGDDWAASIVNAIESAKVMVVVYTDEANTSKQVLNEISNAVQAGVIIVPFKLTKALPSSGMKYYFTSVHWLDAVDLPFEKSVQELSSQIQSVIKISKPDTGNVKPLSSDEPRKTIEEVSTTKKSANKKIIVLAVCLMFVLAAVAIMLLNHRERENEAPPSATHQAISLSTNKTTTATSDKPSVSSITVGSYVTFGHYPQKAEGNDNTPIEWLVLEIQENKALVISRYALDCQPYNKAYESTTWEECSLRSWLNESFLNKAFTTKEQEAILLTTVDNSKPQQYSGWNTSGGINTLDKIFLLSYREVCTYFKSDKLRQCASTDYALQQGSYSTSWWLLRSPGGEQKYVLFVTSDGSLSPYVINHIHASVRPAMWIELTDAGF